MRIIAIFNQKGGVGKTTSTANLGAALAESGQRVVLLDLDPQANLTAHFGIDPDAIAHSTYQVLTDEIPLAEALISVPALTDAGVKAGGSVRVAPASPDLAAAEVELVSVIGRETLLRKMALARKIAADYILIDCPPSLGLLSLNALVFASEVLVPLQAHFLALQGMERLFETISMVRQALNPIVRISGILFCQYESAAKLTAEVSGEVGGFLQQAHGTTHPVADAVIFQTTIRRNIKLAEAPSFGQTIFQYAPASAGAADYAALAKEVLKMKPPAPPPHAPHAAASLPPEKPRPAAPARPPEAPRPAPAPLPPPEAVRPPVAMTRPPEKPRPAAAPARPSETTHPATSRPPV